MAGLPTTGDGASWFRAMDELSRTSVVSIASISGDTSGGGCELGWACDLRIAEEQVLFSQPEVGIGVGTGLGGTSRLRHLIGRTATAEVVLLGQQVNAERMYELGGLNRVVPTGTSLALAIEWAVSIAPDERIPEMHEELRKVKGSDFEVVTPPTGYIPPR